ncbi:Aquaporin-8 [Dirofilaria immitis]
MQPIVQRLSFDCHREKQSTEHSPRNDYQPSSMDFFIPAIAEFVGSFMITFLSIFSYLHTINTQLIVSLIDGAILYILICMLGCFSGAYFNPAQLLSVILIGKCRLAIGFFMIFMQFLGAFFGAVYAKCMLQNNAFAIAMHAAIQWSDTMDDIYETNRLQHFFMELTLCTLICCAYNFTGIISCGRNGTLCASVVAITRAIITFIGYSTIGQVANLAKIIGLSSTAYIFLFIHDEWRFIYIPFFAHLFSAPIAALIYWLSMKYSLENMKSMPKD